MSVQIGLSDLHYAKLIDDDTNTGATYEEPVRVVGAITANMNPNASIETLFGDDGPMETAASMGQIELETIAANFPLSVQAELLGHTVGGDGILRRKSADTPPWVAVGFKSLKSNGKYRYTWLVKGKYSVPELAHQTKGDSIEFQTPTMNGSFVKREADDIWIIQADEDDATFTGAANWFTAATLQSA